MTPRPQLHEFTGAGIRLAGEAWEPDGPESGIVLLLHGGGQTRHSWRRTGQDLAAGGWRAIAVDLRGHGDSDRAPDGDYAATAVAADVRAIAASSPTPPVLVGASLGGMAALLAAGGDPGLARALVLVDITPHLEPGGAAEISDFMRSGLAGFDDLDQAAAAVAAYNPHRERPPSPDGLRKNLRRREGRWYWHWDPQLVEGRHAGVQAQQRIVDRGVAAARRLTVPTMLVRGKQSRVVSTEGVRRLRDLVPGLEVVDVSGAGHMVAGDDNDVFGEHLLGFLSRLPAVDGVEV